MSGSIRSVLALALAGGMMWNCGGDRVTMSQAPDAGLPAPDARQAGGQVGRPLGKSAVNRDLTRAVVVVTMRQDEAPVSGTTVELSRSVSGRAADYQWSGTTDARGRARVSIGSDNVSGYYQARAWRDGSLVGSWSSIPINGGYELTIDLPVGGKARVTGSSILTSDGLDGEIPIGVVMPLTGDGRFASLFVKNGAELARDEVNRSRRGSATIRFIVEDSESKPDVAVSAFNKLIHQDKVPVILGPGYSSSAAVAFPIAQQNRVVAFSPTAAAAGLGAIGDFIFRVPLPVDKLAPGTLEIAKQKLGYRTVAVIYDSTDVFSRSGYEETRKALDDLGVEILTTEAFETVDTDFSVQLTRIRELNPDAILVWTRPEERVEVPVQGRELGIPYTIPFIIFGFTASQIEMAGMAAEGVISSTIWSRSAQTPENQAFVENYRARYGDEPDGFAAEGYANVHILDAAIREAGSIEPGAIRDALAAIDVPTILGRFAFDSNGDPIYPVIVEVVVNGRLEILKE